MTENLGQELESITSKVDESLATDNASVADLTSLQTEMFGYKPLGRLRQVRSQLYTQVNSATARSEEKKQLKMQIVNLRTLEETLATKIDNAIESARGREKSAKEARQAEEHSPVSE